MALYFDDSNYEGDYESSIICSIEGAIESWEGENEFESFDEPLYEQVKEFCNTFVTASSKPDKADSLLALFRELKQAFEQSEEYSGPDFIEFIEFELAKISVGMIASASANLWDLFAVLTQIQKAPIQEIPLNYLRRVLRCYIWGLKPECIILCRSVVEVAIDEKIPDRMCAKFCDPNKPNYTLADKLKTIEKSGLFDKEFMRILNEIRLRGNKCVHGDMDAVKDVKGTVKDTCKALILISELDL